MRKTRLKKFLKTKPLKNRIYVLFEGVMPQYVGLAEKQSVQARLLSHAINYFTRTKRSKLTEVIYKSKYFYGDWTVSMFLLKDVSSLTGKKPHCLRCAERAMYEYLRFEEEAALNGNGRAPYSCRVQRGKGKD